MHNHFFLFFVFFYLFFFSVSVFYVYNYTDSATSKSNVCQWSASLRSVIFGSKYREYSRRPTVVDAKTLIKTNPHHMTQNIAEIVCILAMHCISSYSNGKKRMERISKYLLRSKLTRNGSFANEAGLHPNKVLLCIWYDWKNILHCVLLLPNQALTFRQVLL